MTRQRPFFFDLIVESTRIIFGSRLSDGDTFSIDETWLKRTSRRALNSEVPFIASVVAHEKELIEAALAKSNSRIAGPLGAAAKLGIPRQTLEAKIRSFGIDKHRFRTV
jgi:formate hydrogenlyase transcriptional activator